MFSPPIPPSWPSTPLTHCPPAPPSSPTPSSRPSSPTPSSRPSSPTPSSRPSSPPHLLPTSSPTPYPSSPPTHGYSRYKRARDNEVSEQPTSKQQKIGQFFTKLTRTEGIEQAKRRLAESAEVRGEWVEKQEATERVKRVSHRVANTGSQQRCRMRKKEKEMRSGVRGSNGKIVKVAKLIDSRAVADSRLRNGSPQ